MTEQQLLVQFAEDCGPLDTMKHDELIVLFGYFLTEVAGKPDFNFGEVNQCYIRLDLTPPAKIINYKPILLEKKKIVKAGNRWRISYPAKNEINEWYSEIVKERADTPHQAAIGKLLQELPNKLKSEQQKIFLEEVITCRRVKANRAAVIMTWILCLDHLQEYIFTHKLVDFNNALSKARGIDLTEVRKKDHFNEIKEVRFIELCRSADIITGDERKILDEKLGFRNSCAHPNGILVTDSKADSFIEDLVLNVILHHET